MMSRMRRWCLTTAVLGLVAGMTTRVPAGVVTRFSEAEAEAAGGNLTLETLDAAPLGSVSAGQVTFSSRNNLGGVISNALFGSGRDFQFTTTSLSSITISFANPISAVGFDIFDLGDSLDPTTVDFTLSNGDSGRLFTFFEGTNGNRRFVGVADTTAFQSITLTLSAEGDFVEIDNVRFGSLTPAAVPEPSTIVSAGIAGVIGLDYGWRRRKRASA